MVNTPRLFRGILFHGVKMQNNFLKRFKYIYFSSFNLALHYAKFAINYLDEIQAGNTRINTNFVNKVYLKNNKEDLLNIISSIENILNTSDDDLKTLFVPGKFLSDLQLFNPISEFLSDFSNTIVFRNYTARDGRVISIINSSIDEENKKVIKSFFKRYDLFLNNLYKECQYQTMHSLENIEYKNIGYIKNISIKDEISTHLESKYFVKADIAKFFNHVLVRKMFEQDTFGRVFDIMFEDVPYFEEGETCSKDGFKNLASWLLKLSCMFMTYNGKLPTGAPYSPVLSNIFMLDFDSKIANVLQGQLERSNIKYKITRYVDDFTISCNAPNKESSGIFDLKIVKMIEQELNSRKLFLKYEKTKCYDRSTDNVPVLGYTLVSNSDTITVTGNFRTNLMSAIRSKSAEELDQIELGLIAYYLSSNPEIACLDILSNLNAEHKSEIIENYKDLVFKIRKSNSDENTIGDIEHEKKESCVNLIQAMLGSMFRFTSFKSSDSYVFDIKGLCNYDQNVSVFKNIDKKIKSIGGIRINIPIGILN